MNILQRLTLIISAFVISLLMLNPPFASRGESGRIQNIEYDFLFDPPSYLAVFYELLLTLWVGVLIITVLLFFAFKTTGTKDKGNTDIVDSKTIKLDSSTD